MTLDLPMQAVPATRRPLGGEAILWSTTLAILALMVPTIIAMSIDQRTLLGVDVWVKPFKFQLAGAMHLATLAVLSTLLVEPVRRGRQMTWLGLVAAVTAVAEIAYISIQAMRGRASHFNDSTLFESVMYTFMGLFAVLLTATALGLAWLIWRYARPSTGEGLRTGVVLGLGLGFFATVIVGGYLGNNGGHWVGGTAGAAPVLPLVGWAQDRGDLRVPHFFALHMMQIVPIAGWLADRTIGHGRLIAVLAALICLGMVIFTFAQALAGRPFLQL